MDTTRGGCRVQVEGGSDPSSGRQHFRIACRTGAETEVSMQSRVNKKHVRPRPGGNACHGDDPMTTRASKLERPCALRQHRQHREHLCDLLQNLALVPILLHRWSTETYGIWITLMAVQTLLFTINYGQEAYVGYEAARLLHQDRPALPGLIGASLLLGVLLCSVEVLLIVGLGYTHFTPSPGGGSGFGGSLEAARRRGRLLAGLRLVRQRVDPPSATRSASTLTSRLYTVAFRVMTTMAIALAALCGAGLWGVVLAYSVTTALTQACLAAMALRVARQHDISISRPQFSVIRGILTKSTLVSGTSLLDMFSNNGLLAIISSVLSPGMVPSFSTLRTITNTAQPGGRRRHASFGPGHDPL